ncbi:unnamed protein product, partial [Musa acuminata var. zebrina]
MITGLVRSGDLKNARQLFEEMPVVDAVSCNAILHGYIRRGEVQEAFRLLKKVGSEYDGSSSPYSDKFVLTTLLSACAECLAYDCGKQIHARIVICQVDLDSILGSALVDMYAKCYGGCGRLDEARKIFDRNEKPSVVLWNSIINAYASSNQGDGALELFKMMTGEGIMPNLSTFASVLSACASIGIREHGVQMHACGCKHGILEDLLRLYDTILLNTMINVYSNCGQIEEARKIFEMIPSKNMISWNSMIVGYSQNGHAVQALELFIDMHHLDLSIDKVALASVISSCASVCALTTGEELFALATRIGLVTDLVVTSSLVDLYCKCGKVIDGRRLFDGMPNFDAFGVLHRMQDLGVKVSAFTLSITASCVSSPRQAKQVHGFIIRFGSGSLNTVLGNSLIDMYGRVGLAGYASQIFCAMDNSDVISWNSMISAYGRSGCGMEALECFCVMRAAGFSTDEFTMSSVLNICTDLENLAKGEQLLAHCFKMGFLSNSIVSSAVIDMYSIFGRLDDAVRIFQGMPRWDSVLCDSMYSGYVRSSIGDEAIKLFVVALRKSVMPTEFTFATILNSRMCFCSTDLGMQIHCWVCKTGFEADMIVANALVDMYAKLGFVESAMKLFSKMVAKDLVSWNTIIMGLAKNGQGVEALRIFRELQGNGVKPDRITLVGVLLACSYGHMVHEGKRIFSLMEKKYGVMRDLRHYACMVDMMGRAGMLKETLNIIETSPHSHSLSLWNLLLNACRIHGDLVFATIIAEKLLDLEARFSLPYLVLAQMYGVSGRWESMARVLKAMEERGVRKVREYSWICVRKHIYVFKADQLFQWE